MVGHRNRFPRWGLGPFEHFIELITTKKKGGGSTMRAMVRIGEMFAFRQKTGDFLRGEAISRFDRSLAGHHVHHRVKKIAGFRLLAGMDQRLDHLA